MSLFSLRSICLQWVSPHDEAGDFKPRRNWENFPKQCIWSLMMKFPNKDNTLLFRMLSQLGFECNSNNIPFLVRSKNTTFRPPKLVFAFNMWLQASLGFPRVLLATWADDIVLRGHGLYIFTEVFFGSYLRPAEEGWRQFLVLPFSLHLMQRD